MPLWTPALRSRPRSDHGSSGLRPPEDLEGGGKARVARRRDGPAGLTQPEVEVLVLLARGLSNKAIAAQLVVSPKTVGHHIEHIYRKIGCSTRAAASLFAMQHGLLPEL
jgi:DNA-binding NarL/FixJ family response regulator